MSERMSNRPMAQPQESRNTVIDMNAVSSFTIGDRVFHQKFGYGRIRAVEGNKLEVDFEKAGAKRVIDSFVERH